ncbi:hypothetical protein KYLE_45 [Pantoea phage Kyle]|uniref:Uncharacterized protein n=1 Tax=Pantoea phage Kyle TaxID=2589665 RepID=A0A514A8K1_9CAUD|nr:hypothetical protein HWC52_gp045 [Pantoea phage Kyle]QDH49591.1 hypothetical protein KYLE_45 [Pantoea phage Kyle]
MTKQIVTSFAHGVMKVTSGDNARFEDLTDAKKRELGLIKDPTVTDSNAAPVDQRTGAPVDGADAEAKAKQAEKIAASEEADKKAEGDDASEKAKREAEQKAEAEKKAEADRLAAEQKAKDDAAAAQAKADAKTTTKK